MQEKISLVRALGWPALLFLATETIGRTTNLFEAYPWLDNPLHFFGGFLISITANEFFLYCRNKGYVGKMHPLIYAMILTTFVVTVAVFWEFHEFLRDFYFHTHLQSSEADTMKDLLVGMIGGLLGASLIVRKK